MDAPPRLAFVLASALMLAGCGASPMDSPVQSGLKAGDAAMVDEGSQKAIAWLACPEDGAEFPESVWVDSGTEGRFLGFDGPDDSYARFKPDSGPVVWTKADWVKPIPPAR